MKQHYKLAGQYRLRTYKEDGTQVRDTGWFDNLLLDQGLDQIGSVFNYNVFGPFLFRMGCVGTGSTAPTTADTQLESWLASAGNGENYSNYGYTAGPPSYWWSKVSCRFGTGVAAGNLTEVGMGEQLATNIGTALFSRALILDGAGNPTTLVVASDEILDLSYEFRVYPDTTTNVQTININGTDYTFTWDILNPTTAPQIYYAYVNDTGIFRSCSFTLNRNISGNSTASVTPSSSGYTLGTYTRTYSGTFAQADAAWSEGIKWLDIGTRHGSQRAVISPILHKTNVQYLSITMNVSWSRFTP
jgi:hypothetical protein